MRRIALIPLACAALVLARAEAVPDARGASPTSAPVAQPSGTTDTRNASPDGTDALALADFPSYVKEVESIRNLDFKSPVAKGRQSLGEFQAFIGKELDRELPPGRAECTARALARIGLLPERFDLRKGYSDLLLTQVAAYYNPTTKTFYLVRSDLPTEALKPTVIHELTHALQDQRFGLGARMESLRGSENEDAENAFRFFVEGEATYVMTIATLRHAGMNAGAAATAIEESVEMAAGLGREALAAQLETAKDALGAEIEASMDAVLSSPDYLFRTLLDPYFGGQRAVHRVYRSGGWPAVNGLWKNLPSSTEMLLHPEKLQGAKRDEPVKVTVPDISSVLGPGYAPACENTLGEFETEMLLEAVLPSPASASIAQENGKPPNEKAGAGAKKSTVERARTAAAGWGGDRYRSFEKAEGGTVVVWKTVWDTEQDAIEFDEALFAVSRARIPSGSPIASVIAHHGKEVTFVAGATPAQARAALAALDPSFTIRAQASPAPGSQPSPGPLKSTAEKVP